MLFILLVLQVCCKMQNFQITVEVCSTQYMSLAAPIELLKIFVMYFDATAFSAAQTTEPETSKCRAHGIATMYERLLEKILVAMGSVPALE